MECSTPHTDKNDNVLTSMVDKVDLQKAINVDGVCH